MKILFDPIYTHNPQRCSMTYKMQGLMRQLLDWREDVFCYFLLPEPVPSEQTIGGAWEVDEDWLLQDPRVKYIRIPQWRHRMLQYVSFPTEMQELVAFWGDYWDWDHLITARIPALVGVRRFALKTERKTVRYRSIIAVEDMPVMDFKKFVETDPTGARSMQTLMGYYAADMNLFFSFWERREVLREGRKFLSPGVLKEISSKSFDCNPVTMEPSQFRLKKKAWVEQLLKRERPFTIGYTQRFEVQHRRCNDIFRVMEKQWVFKANDPIRLLITSNSGVGTDVKPPANVELNICDRDKYMDHVENDMAVVIVMSEEDAYPLSLLEPLMVGTPVILLDRLYARKTVGEDYPFFVEDETQAYALCNVFYKYYAREYKRFAEWHRESFVPRMLARNDVSFFAMVQRHLIEHERQLAEFYDKQYPDPAMLPDVPAVAAQHYTPGEHIYDFFKRMDAEGKTNNMAHWVRIRGRKGTSKTTWEVNWQLSRLAIQHYLGLKDASVELGVYE